MPSIRPPLRPPLRPPVRSPLSPSVYGGGPSLTAQVQALFAGGKVGGMWDMGDTSTLYQQGIVGGTTFSSVASAGQQIGAALDKSQKTTWTDNTGSTWTKTGGDGVVTVVGNVITITGATTATTVDRSGGTIPLVAGVAQIDVTAAWSVATSPLVWCRGIPQVPPNGSAGTVTSALNNSALERVQIGSGTATFTINSLKYWEGNHATQPTAGLRPLYQVVSSYGCAQFDGTNDLLQVSGINLSATNKVLIGLAFKPNTTAGSIAMEYSSTAVSNVGAFYVSLNESGTGKHNMLANNGGSGLVDVVTLSSAVALAPTVLIDYIDLAQLVSTAKHSVRVNGASADITSIIDGPDVAGNFGNYDLFLGARSGSSVPSNMNLYRAFVLAGSSTAGEQLILENWLRESCGV